MLKQGSSGRCPPLELSLGAYMTFTPVKDECALNYLLDPALRDVSCSQEHLLLPRDWELRISAVTLPKMLEFPCWGSSS